MCSVQLSPKADAVNYVTFKVSNVKQTLRGNNYANYLWFQYVLDTLKHKVPENVVVLRFSSFVMYRAEWQAHDKQTTKKKKILTKY